MINYSRQLIEAARSVLADGYYDCQSMQPDDLAVFQQSIASRAPEAERFTFNELRELVEIASSRDDRDPDYEWIGSNGRTDLQEENDEEEAFQEDEEEESEVPAEDVDAQVVKEHEDKRRALEAINRVLNVYYPYKTLSAATDFDRLRALFAEEVPELADNISDERLKMYLFAVGGTLIGQLRPREERLAEAKRRAANPGAAPPARSYESARPSRMSPRSNAYDVYDKVNGASQEREPSSPDGSDSNDQTLDAQAEAITRAFGAPRTRVSQFRPSSPIERTYAQSSNDSNNGYGSNANLGDRAPSRRFDGASNGYSSRYGERPGYGERPPRQSYGAPYERQGYQGYDRYGSDRQGYERSDYGRGDYGERSYGSERFGAPSRPYYGERQGGCQRQGNPRYNGGFQSDGYARSYDSDSNGRASNGRQSSYPNSGLRNGYSNGGYANGYSTNRAQGYSGLQEYRNSHARASNESFGAGVNPVSPASFNSADPPLADVVRVMREILTNFFPDKQVRLGAEYRRLRVLTSFKFPQANFSDDKLQMFVAYAGGSLIGSFPIADSESLLGPTDYSSHTEGELREVATELLRFFPGSVVDKTQGFEKFRVLFNARFDEDSVHISDETLKKIIRVVGGILPGQDEAKEASVDGEERFAALVCVAKKVLETKFSHSVFKRDLSDFTRFRIQFERLAGTGATLNDSELRDVFVAAGGVFEEEPKPQEKPVVKLARSVMIKKVVSEKFPDGLDGKSHDDLDRFRQYAKEYDFNFDEETDAKLCAIVARCCVHFEDKIYSVPEEGKAKIKKLVESLFSVGTQVIYYETYFEKNAAWLKEYNVNCAGLLLTLLANYFSDYLFYPDYFEKTQCADSERVKLVREIERVWGSADEMTTEALAERLCAPEERIRKALEISVGNYVPKGDAFVHASTPAQIADDEKLDDQFDACFENNDDEEDEPLDVENVDEEIDDEEDDEEEEEETVESADALQTDSSNPSLFDMLLKEEEEENAPVVLPPSDESEEESEEGQEIPQVELDVQILWLMETMRAYFPEGIDVESKDELALLKEKSSNNASPLLGSNAQIVDQIKRVSLLSGGRYLALTKIAKDLVGELLDEWFNAGGKLVYYAVFWKKRQAELTENGICNERVLIDVMKDSRPYFRYYDSYVEETESDESEHAKVKAEILRYWVTDTAKRIHEFEAALYIPKTKASETFRNDADFTSSSNGYWTKTPQKNGKSKAAKGTKSSKTSQTATKKTAVKKTAVKKSATKKSASKKS